MEYRVSQQLQYRAVAAAESMWCSAMPHQSVGATTTGTSVAAISAPALQMPSHRIVFLREPMR